MERYRNLSGGDTFPKPPNKAVGLVSDSKRMCVGWNHWDLRDALHDTQQPGGEEDASQFLREELQSHNPPRLRDP